jgi:hypothetical protein
MITRYRGDTQTVKVTLKKDGGLVNLDDIDNAEMGIDKKGVIIVLSCTKDADPLTGVVYAPFQETTLDVTGTFSFDVQVTWNDLTKTTFLVDRFKVLDDINKT